MNAPYIGRFRVSQQYSSAHTGLDLVGVDSKEIHSTVTGTVMRAGWENPNDHSKGFGLRVVIKRDGTDEYYYFGHLSEIRCKAGDKVKITDVIGIEGSTGHSTGSHCHYECRLSDQKAKHRNISTISGIPNAIGTYDDGYRPSSTPTPTPAAETKEVVLKIGSETWKGTLTKQ